MREKARILFTTAYSNTNEPVGLLGGMRQTSLRVTFPRVSSWGLRFIKQNFPWIEIMEYPTWEQYTKKVQEGWDVVGFSFYLADTPEVLEMVDYARKHGVGEVWGGNYGVLTDGVSAYFDKIFVGYAEEQIATTLGIEFESLKHPPLTNYVGTPFGLKIYPVGMLFSSRGCNMKCSFCQASIFCPEPHTLSLESIEKVLAYYRRIGLREVALADESFGFFRKHSEHVINLLQKYGFYWTVLTRIDFLAKNLKEWMDRGLRVAIVGIESVSQENLDALHKRHKIEEIIDTVQKMRRRNRFFIGSYIIGLENDTDESVRANIETLSQLKPHICSVDILTPLPGTPQWQYLYKRYGPFESDYSKFDDFHLIFKHPHFSQKTIDELLEWSRKRLFPKRRILELAMTYIRQYSELEGSFSKGIQYILTQLWRANRYDYHSKRMLSN